MTLAELFPGDALDRARNGLNPEPRPDPVAWVSHTLGEDAWSLQAEVMRSVAENRRTAVKACFDVGKALAVDTPIFMADGRWTTMGELVRGDYVLGAAGAPVMVTAAHPIRVRPCYRVSFSDGSSVVADDDHLWTVHDHRTRAALRGRTAGVGDWREFWPAAATVTTAAMAGTVHYGACPSLPAGFRNWSVPLPSPLKGSPSTLPVPAYTFGAWLGDGTTIRAEITSHLADAGHMAAMIAADGLTPEVRVDRHHESTVLVRFGRPTVDCPARVLWGITGTKATPEAKAIPPAYLVAPWADRLAVLRGLMDTDGFQSTGASVGLDLMNEVLARDALTLVRTLGWRATLRTKTIPEGTVWRVQYRPDINPFTLPRKRDRWSSASAESAARQAVGHTLKTVTAVEKVPDQPTRCITVDADDGLFLAGDGLTPTHNSFSAARLMAWWIASTTAPAFALSTAPTFAQVRAILWREIGIAHRKGRLPGRVNQTEWHLAPDRQHRTAAAPATGETLVAFGRKPSSADSGVAFQGIHSGEGGVLLILDEAAGVPRALWDAAEGIMADESSRILAIGNPDDPVGPFADCFLPGSEWAQFTISAFDSPNFTGEQVAPQVARSLVSRLWVEERRRVWGEEHPLWQSRVLGEFPDTATDTVVPLAWARAAQARELEPPEAPPILGVDVARFGTDDSAIAAVYGPVVTVVEVMSGKDTIEVSGRVRAVADSLRADQANVDGVGIGAGVVDNLRSWSGRPTVVNDMQAGGRPQDPERFVNARSEWWWALRERAESGDLDLPSEGRLAERLLAEITGPKYRYDARGRIAVETKEELRLRGIGSPDLADACIMALAPPPRKWTPLPVGPGGETRVSPLNEIR